MLAWARPHKSHGGVSTSSNLRVCALMLVCADVIRPSLEWLLSPQAPQNLVPLMAKLRDPDGFAELGALCDASRAGRTMKAAALRRAATILVVKGGTLHDVTVGDCLELSLAIDGRTLRSNKAMSFYQLLHEMGVFGPQAPTTLRAFGTCGQFSPAQLIDRHAIVCRPVRDLLVAYLAERQPMLDHTTLRNLAFNLGGLFWRDLERHHPGIASLRLAPEVSAAWKQRMTMKTRRVIGANGEMTQVSERRAESRGALAAVRGFYLDIAQWAMEDPARWGPWAAPCPIRPEDLARQKEIRSRKSRMDQRTRERLPLLAMLQTRVNDERLATAACLQAAEATEPGAPFTIGDRTMHRVKGCGDLMARVWVDDPESPKRRDADGRGGPSLLDLGGGRNAAAHRDPDRRTHRAQPSQPYPIHASRHRRDRAVAADRTLKDRHRAVVGHQPRASRRPRHDHWSDPRQRRSRRLRRVLRLSRAGLECAHAAAVPAPVRHRKSSDPGRHATRMDRRGARRGPASTMPRDGLSGSPRTTSAGCSSPT